MKLALLGDIHSNYKALEQCLEYCEQERVDGYVFLGDYISDCPYPGRTLEMIRKILDQYPSWIIRGNREWYQINHQENEEINNRGEYLNRGYSSGRGTNEGSLRLYTV